MTSNQISLKNETKLNALLESHSGSVGILYAVLSESAQGQWSEGSAPERARLYHKTYPVSGACGALMQMLHTKTCLGMVTGGNRVCNRSRQDRF
jgi:hypothetical protein